MMQSNAQHACCVTLACLKVSQTVTMGSLLAIHTKFRTMASQIDSSCTACVPTSENNYPEFLLFDLRSNFENHVNESMIHFELFTGYDGFYAYLSIAERIQMSYYHFAASISLH